MEGIYFMMKRNEKCFAANQLHEAVKQPDTLCFTYSEGKYVPVGILQYIVVGLVFIAVIV